MKIVYHCYGGAHASPTAAAIHLGILPPNRWPSFADIQAIPYFDAITRNQHGRMIKVGQDSQGNEVYILARRNSVKLIPQVIKEFTKLSGNNTAEYHFVNCVQLFNPFMVTGGFSSRAMGWVNIGRPIVTFGTILSFHILAGIVRDTKRKIEAERS